jgi:hypothetical protein
MAQDVPKSTARLFDYDSRQPFDLRDKAVEEFDGGAVHDVIYTKPVRPFFWLFSSTKHSHTAWRAAASL